MEGVMRAYSIVVDPDPETDDQYLLGDQHTARHDERYCDGHGNNPGDKYPGPERHGSSHRHGHRS